MRIVMLLGRALERLHRGERGQVLFMFIAITIVFFFIAVIAVDGSLWQSQRRTAQKDADASALAAGQELLSRPSPPNPTAIQTPAAQAATEWVTRNGIDPTYFTNGAPAIPATTQASGCFGGPPYDWPNPDSVTVDLQNKGSSIFASIFNLLGADVGAHAKVCIGSPVDAEGILPFAIQTSPSINPDCFDATTGAPLFGATCDITVRASDGSSGETGTMLLYNDGSTECSSANPPGQNAQEFVDEVANGADTACAVAAAGTTLAQCGTQQYVNGIGSCVWVQTGNQAGKTLEGLQTRLSHEGAPIANPPDPKAWDCDALFPNATLGGVNDKVDQWWEALVPAGNVDITAITPGPDVTFLKRACTAPRLVTLILIPQFIQSGQCKGCPIQGFAGFFIRGCRDEDGNFNQRCVTQNCKLGPGNTPCPNPTGEPLLKNTGQLSLEGMFINYVDIGRHGGPLNQFGRIQLFLVE